jgi:hypothetical protein
MAEQQLMYTELPPVIYLDGPNQPIDDDCHPTYYTLMIEVQHPTHDHSL